MMKISKILAAVLSGILAIGSFSTSGLVGFVETGELLNDTFESGYSAWKGVGSSLTLSTDQAHGGSTSL
ncbi:MAG: hypothetical protein LUC50_07380 [Ruminococcus sp.]|nr:hypothetical protein [Ruminococcus sp.]